MEKDIGRIKKNDQSDIVIRVDDFAEKRGLTIREFVSSDRYTGFTKAGVRILASDFLKFKEMINSIPDEDMKDSAPVEVPEVPSAPEEAPKEEVAEHSEEEKKATEEELPDY